MFLLGEDIGTFGGAFGVTTGLLEEFGEARVNLGAAERIGDLEDSGGEQRMCEPDSVAVRLDDAGLARRRKPDIALHA